MNYHRALTVLSISICLLWGCTYDIEKVYFSESCKTDFTGFPDIPGWNFSAIPIDDSITVMRRPYFFEDKKGLLFTNTSIWLTENEGTKWEKVYSGPIFNVEDISFIDQYHLFVAIWFQNSNRILKTNDGGRTWYEINYQPEQRIEHMSFVDSLRGVASLSKSNIESYIAWTSNGGLTWEEIPGLSSTNITRPGIKLNPDGFGYAPGNKGEIHFTSDFGENWITIQTGFDNLIYIQFLDRNTGFIGDYQYLYKTGDGGNSWTKASDYRPVWFRFFSPSDAISLQNVDSKFDYDVIINCNAIFTTSDGGLTWGEGPPSISFYLQYLNFVNDNLGYGLTYDDGYRIVKIFR